MVFLTVCHLLKCTGVAEVELGMAERRYALPGQPQDWQAAFTLALW